MGQRSKGERVLGPYPIGKQWRVVVVGAGGERHSRFYPSEEKAREVIRAVNGSSRRTETKTMKEGSTHTRCTFATTRATSPGRSRTPLSDSGVFFPDGEMLLHELDARTCEAYYEVRSGRGRADWKAVRRRQPPEHPRGSEVVPEVVRGEEAWLARNPLDEVEGVGKRRHGKAQLRIDEARRWPAKALELADGGRGGRRGGDDRAGDGDAGHGIVSRVARDLDDEGKLLWIPDSKTEAGRRTLQVPELLAAVPTELVEGKAPSGLFGQHWRDWVGKWVRRICKRGEVP